MRSAGVASLPNLLPDIHPAKMLQHGKGKVLECQITGSRPVTSPHFAYAWLCNTKQVTYLWNFPLIELYYS